jgi:hypothetical protein
MGAISQPANQSEQAGGFLKTAKNMGERKIERYLFEAKCELAPVSLDTTLSTETEKEWPS